MVVESNVVPIGDAVKVSVEMYKKYRKELE